MTPYVRCADAATAQFQQAQESAQRTMAERNGGQKGEGSVVSPDGTPAAPVKEKTFLEKNWLLLAAGGMLLMNLMAPPAPVPSGAAAAATPGVAAAGAAAVAASHAAAVAAPRRQPSARR